MNIRDIGHYDVLVAGAGPAGFAAAIAAARCGASTALIEKYSMAGGVMTVMGNNTVDEFVNPYIPKDRMIIKGIAWEFVKKLHAMGYALIPDFNEFHKINQMYSVGVDPVAAAKLLDDMLIEAGVDLYYMQPLVAVETEKDGNFTRVSGAVISTKAGLARISADFFIDATGDGDLSAWAGNDFEIGGENGELQPGSLRYYIKGTPTEEGLARGNAAIAAERAAGKLEERDLLYNSTFTDIVNSCGDNRNHIDINSADSADRTRAEIDARRRLLMLSDAIRNADTGISIHAVAPETAARESRRILCDGYLTADDYISCRLFPDSVCYTYWFIDIHDQKDFTNHHVYLRDEKTPSIPLSAMRPRSLSNVYVAGRCISGDRSAVSAVRVKASCMAMGEAVGTAAALGCKAYHKNTRETDMELIRKTLSENGAIVPGIDSPGRFDL